MTDGILRETKQMMQLVIDAFKDQLGGLHVGRATSSMVENIQVDYYGSRVPMKQVGSIAIPEGNQITITPWDKGALAPIESAIRESDLKVNPVNDGRMVRIVLPALTEERRRELTKVVGKMAEEARIALRNERRDSWEKIQTMQKEAKITEDDRERGREDLDKLIDQMNKEVEEIAKAKENEMMSL